MGKRGPQKGTLYKPTIDKAFQREVLRQMIIAKMGPMTEAQIKAAQGLNVAVVRRKDGTYRRIDSPEAFDKAVEREELIEVQTLQPSTQAYTDLMNRALDMPAKPADDLNISGELVIKWQGE